VHASSTGGIAVDPWLAPAGAWGLEATVEGWCTHGMTSTVDDIALELQRVFATRDLDALGNLLADDARWGDDDAINKCRNRQQVVGTFARLLDEGADGGVDEMRVGRTVSCANCTSGGSDRPRRESFYHLYFVREGRIVEIRRYDDRDSAIAALGDPATPPATEHQGEDDQSRVADAYAVAIHSGDLQTRPYPIAQGVKT